MERFEVINGLLGLFDAPSYLEIGVDQGTTFAGVVAPRKVGVDIRFAFDWQALAAQPELANHRLVEASSDDYFLHRRDGETFDIIFIDGLHTYEQTLRDLMNSWSVLRPGGIVIVDDVMPTSYAASIPDLNIARTFWTATNNTDGAWMGDVFRLVYFIESFMPAFSYAMVAENHGQLIMWLDERASVADRSILWTAQMQYVDAIMNAGSFRVAPFVDIRSRLATWRTRQVAG